MPIHPLPTKAADITSPWLTDVLHDSGALAPQSSVSNVAWEPLGEGAGMMSDLALLRLSYANEGGSAPATLVVKLPAESETNRAVALQFDIYAREVRYYAELDPICTANGPAIHLSVIDSDKNFAIVMEDLSDYHIGDQITGATLEETEIAIDELAKLHSSFWDKADQIDWVPDIATSDHASIMRDGIVAGWDAMLDAFGQFVPDAINDNRSAIQQAIAPLQRHLDAAPITLLHGDFRMDNLFYGRKPGQHPLVILDWQGPLLGRGIQDVAQLLAQSTQTEVRRAHQRELIQRYVNALATQGVSGYGFDEAWEDYRRATLYSWAYVVVVSGTLDANNERGFAWMSKMVARNSAAIEDLDCLRLL